VLARLQIVDGLISAVARRQEILEVVASAPDRRAALQHLQAEPFSYSEAAAHHVLDLPIGRMTSLGRQALEDERRELQAELLRLADP
jgi:DNA gyrase/topoisomerase IV subunit A